MNVCVAKMIIYSIKVRHFVILLYKIVKYIKNLFSMIKMFIVNNVKIIITLLIKLVKKVMLNFVGVMIKTKLINVLITSIL